MEINWVVLTYGFIALFALSGFFKGWWKEAIITCFLAVLVLFLLIPDFAQTFIDLLNFIFATIAGFLPDSVNTSISNFLETYLGVETINGAIQLDATNGGTWIVFLLLFLGAAIFIGRSGLPSWHRQNFPYSDYTVTPGGGLSGGLIGALNGLLIVSLVSQYLSGHNLPQSSSLAMEIAGINAQTVGAASSNMSLQAAEMPNFTILDSYLPWMLVGFSVLLILAVMKSRINILKDKKEGYRKVEYKAPLGYVKTELKAK